MQEAFEKIIEQLEEERELSHADFDRYVHEVGTCLDAEYDDLFHRGIERAIKIVKQEAEKYNNGWIPVSERLPDLGKRILLQDFGGNITLEKCKLKKKVKGFTDGNLWASADNYIAWQPLPAPYQPNGE